MKIPNRFKMKKKQIEVTYQKDYVHGKHFGLWDPNSNVIIISDSVADSTKELTFVHEMLHCLSELYDIGLTEKQVEALDGPLYRMIKKLWIK